ncbi:MAG: anaerobic sulfatase maturase [Anaerofustis stercorihominis]|nr:anaerobic sulfatase maturase [Anaerofustis stercorihominis]
MIRDNSKRTFAVIAKPVGSRCNMRCSYCYYLEKDKFSVHKKQSKMNISVLESLIKQAIQANEGPVVSFTWHGGEPTMAGIDFFKKVVEIERKYLPDGWQVWNNLQTNGILINNEWCRFLRDNHFDVGLSIDGDELTHNKNRLDKSGRPTYAKVKKAAELLLANGIEADLLCTVTADSEKRPGEVYRALRELNTGWIQFIPVIVRNEDGSIDPISASPEGYGSFLCEVFDEWAYNDLGKVDVQLFAEISKIKAGSNAGLCYLAPTCGQVLIAEEDGGIYSCDHFVDDIHRLGYIPESEISSMIDGEFQQAFGNSKRESLTKECLSCEWLRYCNGGCLKDRISNSEDGEAGQYYLCKSLKMFFEQKMPILDRIMQLSREKHTPQQIMNILNAEK